MNIDPGYSIIIVGGALAVMLGSILLYSKLHHRKP